MDRSEGDRSSDEGSQLNRNRSFKSKQLVRSQAIRESQSPPRTISPAAIVINNNTLTKSNDNLAKSNDNVVKSNDVIAKSNNTAKNDIIIVKTVADSEVVDLNEDDVDVSNDVSVNKRRGDTSSHTDDKSSANSIVTNDEKKQQVEIQITPGAWDSPPTERTQRTKRWLTHKQHSSWDLLSHSPRVACVCGACNATQCRCRRRKPVCPTKQDSGIVCSDDCPDCSDTDPTGLIDGKKANSLDKEDTFCRCNERKEKSKSISLSRTDSDDKEPTGLDLVEFLKETLNKNARDRLALLRIEKELHSLVNDSGRCIVRFPVMSSYGRMLVHRCAALFQLSHHLDQTSKNSVLVSKSGTSGGRIPCTSFKQWCTTAFPPSPQRRTPDHVSAKSILKRATHSLDDGTTGSTPVVRSKSLEQRERDYERVRNKIFNEESQSEEWPWLPSGPVSLLTPDSHRNKLLKVQSLESHPGPSLPPERRGAVAKSHSFGGSVPAEGHRNISRQGDLASSSWRLSPSSSGYRTLSVHTDSPTSGGASPEPTGMGALVWAVTDVASVPTGAVVIHPQTGRPLTNPDGSIYHFDPNNPPVMYDANSYTSELLKSDQNNEKRRGRLEKQNSFIDSGDCECQPTEVCHTKYYEDVPHINSDPAQNPSKKNQNPPSPCKKRYDTETPTNQSTPQNPSTNHKEEPKIFEPRSFHSTNQRPAFENEQTNHRTVFENEQAQRPERNFVQKSYESNYEPAKQERYEQKSFEKYEPSNLKSNYGKKATNQEQDCTQYYGQYPQTYRNDEMISPPQMQVQYMQPDMSGMSTVPAMTHKLTPVVPDPNIRPISLTSMVYPTVPQHYPYVRMDSTVPVYQPIQAVEEAKPTPSTTETTFRIDPSYPYQPMDYSQCGGCSNNYVDTALQHRSYAGPYPTEAMYPITNVLVPHPHQNMAQYPYQEQIQWPVPIVQPQAVNPRVLVHELYPMMPLYQPYLYQPQQVVPQPIPLCPPVYQDQRRGSVASQRTKRNSTSGSSRTTPLPTPPTHEVAPGSDTPKEQHNACDIAVRIQQIKEQMANLNTRDKNAHIPVNPVVPNPTQPTEGHNPSHHTTGHNPSLPTAGPRKEEWRRNSGNGILGNYPANFNGRLLQTSSEDTQINSAAQAIVNSIRHMQANKGYNQDRRPDFSNQNRDKRRPDDNHHRNQGYHHNQNRNHPGNEQYRSTGYDQYRNSTETENRMDERDGRRNVPFQYRPPYLLRQMSPGTWCRKSPGPTNPALNPPRRPHPDSRNPRR